MTIKIGAMLLIHTLVIYAEPKKTFENITFENSNEIAEVAVIVDGTWQKRGYSSKIVEVFILSVLSQC